MMGLAHEGHEDSSPKLQQGPNSGLGIRDELSNGLNAVQDPQETSTSRPRARQPLPSLTHMCKKSASTSE